MFNRPKRQSPRLALLTWSRNDDCFLAANLIYHFRLGVRRAYVFLDRCTDSSEHIARSLPWVRTFVLDPQETASFAYVPDVQAICMNHALRLARAEGFDWLLALDPDEFAFAAEECRADATAKQQMADGDLIRLLEQTPPNIEVVRLQTKELIPMDLGDDAPFWRQRFFQFKRAAPRTFANPMTGEVQRCERFIGHADGKPILRTTADAQAYDPHQWVCNQERRYPQRPEYVPLRQEWRGVVYHFHLTSHRHWREKYTVFGTEPNCWQDGTPQEFPKPCWKEANLRLSDAELQGYFARWVAMPQAELHDLVRQGCASEERVVEQILSIAPWGVAPVAKHPITPFRLLGQIANLPPHHGCMAKSDPARLDGFYRLECDGQELFRWSKPVARVRLHALPDDYLLTIDMKHLCNLWNGRLQLELDDRCVDERDQSISDGAVRVRLRREDFGAGEEHWLRLTFDAIDTSSWPSRETRDLGAPIFGITLERPCGNGSPKRKRGSEGTTSLALRAP